MIYMSKQGKLNQMVGLMFFLEKSLFLFLFFPSTTLKSIIIQDHILSMQSRDLSTSLV